MMYRTFLLLVFVLFLLGKTTAQTWKGIVPLKSNRSDIDKIQRVNGSNFLNLENEKIIINYYEGGCNQTIEKVLKLSKDTVIEAKVIPKTEILVDMFSSGFYQGRYEKLSLSDKQNLYIDSINDLIIIGEISESKPEVVTSLFLIPEISKLDKCLLDKMDPIVRQAFEKSKIKDEIGKSFFYESVYLTYPDFSRWNTKRFDNFSKILSESQNSRGIIIVYADKNSRSDEITFWIEKIKKHLVEMLKVDKNSLVFINGGYRQSAESVLYILPKDMPIPSPSPTIITKKN